MGAELRTYVDIDATPERVWGVLMDLPAYPEWNPFVRTADGNVTAGSGLALTIAPLNGALRVRLRPSVLEVTVERRLRFLVRFARVAAPGLFDAEHVLTLDTQDGGVRLWEEVQLTGLLVPLLSRSLNRDRSAMFAAMNASFKAHVEGRPTDG
jgi:hypothetical protein